MGLSPSGVTLRVAAFPIRKWIYPCRDIQCCGSRTASRASLVTLLPVRDADADAVSKPPHFLASSLRLQRLCFPSSLVEALLCSCGSGRRAQTSAKSLRGRLAHPQLQSSRAERRWEGTDTFFTCAYHALLNTVTNKRAVEQNDFSSSSALCDAVRSKLRLALPLGDDDLTVVRKSFDARRVRGEHRCCWNYVVDVRERALLAARPRKKLDPLSGQLERCSAAPAYAQHCFGMCPIEHSRASWQGRRAEGQQATAALAGPR